VSVSFREDLDRAVWLDGLRRRWGLVMTDLGLPPAEATAPDLLMRQIRHGVMSINDAREALGLAPWREAA
jgi:hypothetical protein